MTNKEKENLLTPELVENRNKIIGEFLDFTFDEALIQVDKKFETETEFSNTFEISEEIYQQFVAYFTESTKNLLFASGKAIIHSPSIKGDRLS